MSVVSRPFAPGARTLRERLARDAGELAARRAASGALLRVSQLVLATATGLGLVSLLLCSLFVRYTSHAFQMAVLLHKSGFIGGQVAWYMGWTGRFAANATWLAAVAAGPGVARLLPTVYLLGWGAALWFALPRAAALTGRRLDGVSRVLAVEVVIFATLAITPALWFDLFKLAGSITYGTPLVLATAALAVGMRAAATGRLGARGQVVLALLCGFGIGYSDTFAGVQPVLVVGFTACSLALRGRRRAIALRCGLVAALASVVGLLVLLHAPGNTVRRALYPPPPHLATALQWSARDAWQFLTGPVAHSGPVLPLVALGFLVLGITAAPLGDRAVRGGLSLRRVATALAGLAVVLVAAHLTAEQMTSAPPPPRSEIIPTYAVVMVLALLSWWTGVTLAQRRSRAGSRSVAPAAGRRRITGGALVVATSLAVIAPAATMATVARSWTAMSGYAAAEDAQWRLAAAAAPGSDVVVPPVPATTGIGPLSHDPSQELQPNPRYWVNQAYAGYFGLRSVRAAAH